MSSKTHILWPELYIVGAAKCGTSSLAHYVAQHPDVGMCRHKEPNYFALADRNLLEMSGPASGEVLYKRLYSGSASTAEAYHKLFSHVSDKPVLADASVRYLYSERAAARIHQVSPNAKIVILLREPARRAWSHYAMMKYLFGLEPLSWRAALCAEDERIAAGWDYDWHYASVGMYASQVKRYLDLFGHSQVRIYWHNEFAKDPRSILRDVFAFAGLDPSFEPDVSEREKSGFKARSIVLEQFINKSLGYDTHARIVGRKSALLVFLRKLNRQPLPAPPYNFLLWFKERAYADKVELEKTARVNVPW